jgi:hypothetical protein
MSSDDALRQELITSSRRHATCDRERLAHSSPGWLPLALSGTAAVLACSLLRSKPRLVSAFVVAAGASLTAFWLRGHRRPTGFDEAESDAGGEQNLAHIDEASRESFPASDAPAHHRRT